MTSAATSDRQAAARALAVAAGLVAFPFLFPLVAGPSANAWQLFASWACVAFLALPCGPARPSRGLALWLGVVALSITLAPAGAVALKVSAVAAVAVVALAACVGAAWVGGARSAQPVVPPAPVALAWGLLAAGLVSAVLGLLQYDGHAAVLVPWTTAPELGQAYGNLRQRNQFATLIGMALVAGLTLYGGWTRGQRIASLPGVLLLLLAAAASTSRTGLLQWVLISGVAAFIAWRERHRPCLRDAGAPGTDLALHAFRLPHPGLLLALVPAYFIAAWALPMLAGPEVEDMLRRLRDGAPEGHSRLLLWHNVLELIAVHPWRGWGWGELSFAHYSHPYAGPRFVEILDNAHNLPLHLAVELGIPAAVAICGGFTWLVLAAPPWRARDPVRLMAWGVLGAIVLHSLLEYPLWYGPFQLVFGLCLGLLWPGAPAAAEAPGAMARGRGWVAANAVGAAAALLLAGVAYAGWDYVRISQIYLAREDRLPVWRDGTVGKLQASWLFARQVQFAELSLTLVDRRNAAEVHAQALRALHFSPEPRVIVKLIDSAVLLGRTDEAMAQAVRLQRAFPEDYIRWLAGKPPDAADE
ncbi:PglL family O-oligosaccharyltransferase [Variovorax ginsengisoli]|uniref:O-antigen ligase n=1 Tax=Variovorax ginsengisoli TaxID=363844 RepID=A0ABT9S8Y3_9BURK|nr:O-antigen ligase family protein [Variovorax ginsengisoli]MDP9900226.1 O-antigen ligase [Variovorax ginsengisoli]